MTGQALIELIDRVVAARTEFQFVELKAARTGCPSRLYDTISSFSNSDVGGVIIFGIDEDKGFEKCGVYDLGDLQQKVTEQCDTMTPKVRPVFSYVEIGPETFICSVEIPSIDITERPCFYSGKGRLKGSYVRVGTNDEPMTEYEIYSYEAFRKKYQDDVRVVSRVTDAAIDQAEFNKYIELLRENKPNLSRLGTEQITELMSLTKNGEYTLVSTLLFSIYPQAFFPQLCIVATALPGKEIGQVGKDSERFLDNARIEGTISEMLSQALSFVRKNIRTKTIINSKTGERTDVPDYPIDAIREIILNALVHRDYSIHTEGMPIQMQIFSDRMEITNPGGLYGRISVDQLGKTQPDTRNPVLATALELLKITENRYSGIPTIRREMSEAGLPAPRFENVRGTFKVTLFREAPESEKGKAPTEELLEFCSVPRSRKEIADYLGIKTVAYVMASYVKPLIEEGRLAMTNPERPRSSDQKFYTKI